MSAGSWREHLASIRPDADLADAEWWKTEWPDGTPPAVGFVIPRGFGAYARVLHPAGDEAGSGVRWAQVAAVCGSTLHPEAQWMPLAGHRELDPHGRRPEPIRWEGRQPPRRGCLEAEQFEALADVLGRHTGSPERTIVAFWVGYGTWPTSWHVLPTARLLPSQSYLFERPLTEVPRLCSEAPAVAYALGTPTGSGVWFMSDGTTRSPSPDEQFEAWAPHQWQSPTAWWPVDRAWVISSNPDHDSTLVGGSRALIDDLLADDRLEALPWPVDGSLWADADAVNQ